MCEFKIIVESSPGLEGLMIREVVAYAARRAGAMEAIAGVSESEEHENGDLFWDFNLTWELKLELQWSATGGLRADVI